ncbi:hypothetical protein [Streptomyces sp. NPDC004266]|uniref:hypothetical protein n=1 Tax=Streptomyces sp. NPDC004266 TaxID=3364693 RepID=UPI0036ABD440
MAGLTCHKPGKRSRTLYSVREYRGREGEPKGIGRRDLCDLLVRAHIQPGGPIVLVWDNLRMHLVDGCLTSTGLITDDWPASRIQAQAVASSVSRQ